MSTQDDPTRDPIDAAAAPPPRLLLDAVVHSTTDPYATAVLVADGVVAWLGSDETASRVAGPGTASDDLAGAVVAPAFVEPWGTEEDAADALRRGTAVVTVLAAAGRTAGQVRATVQSGPAPARVVVYREAGTVDPDAAGVWLACDAGTEPGTLGGLVAASASVGEQVYLVPAGDGADGDSEADARAQAAALAALHAAAADVGSDVLARTRPRLVLTHPLTEADRDLLSRTAASVCVAVRDGRVQAPVAGLLAAGIPVCLSAAGAARAAGDVPSGAWAAMRALLEHPDADQRVSARAAFTAATRTGLRALPEVPGARVEASPRLAVGEPATFAVWRADAVGVQSPDERVAAWSTDTRAGTPLLPALDADTALPRWAATWVDGVPAATGEGAGTA